MFFAVLSVETGEPVTSATFASAQEANAFRATIPTIRTRIAPAPIDDSIWRQRESDRLESGEYVALPQWWRESAWWRDSIPARDHFAHRANDGLRIAYTESSAKGAADRQTVTPASSYLARFFGDVLKPHEIADIAGRFETDSDSYTFEVHDSAESFRKFYIGHNMNKEGNIYPSCMRYTFDQLPIHPAETYAAGDLALCTLHRGAEYVARAIVWPNESSFVCVYGLTEQYKRRLVNELESRGYDRTDAFEGARLRKVEFDSRFVIVPYLDGDISRLRDDGDSLVIDSDGEIDASGTRGYTRIEERYTCAYCGENCSEDYMRPVAGGELVCESCVSDKFIYCEYESEYYPNIDTFHEVRIRNYTETWHESAVRAHAFYCESTEEYYSNRHYTAIEVETESGSQVWCEEKTAEDCFYCEKTDSYYSAEDFDSIEVETAEDTQTWCKQETEGAFVVCAETGKAYTAGMAAILGIEPLPDIGIIHDSRQIALAFA